MKSLIILLFVFVSCGEMERETVKPMFYDMSRKFGEYTELWLANYRSGNRDSMMYYSGKCAAASEAMDYFYKKMYGKNQ